MSIKHWSLTHTHVHIQYLPILEIFILNFIYCFVWAVWLPHTKVAMALSIYRNLPENKPCWTQRELLQRRHASDCAAFSSLGTVHPPFSWEHPTTPCVWGVGCGCVKTQWRLPLSIWTFSVNRTSTTQPLHTRFSLKPRQFLICSLVSSCSILHYAEWPSW